MGYRKSLAGIVLVTAAAMAPTAASAAVTYGEVEEILLEYAASKGQAAIIVLAEGMFQNPGDEMTIAMAAVKSGVPIDSVKIAYASAEIAKVRLANKQASRSGSDQPTSSSLASLTSQTSATPQGNFVGGMNVHGLLLDSVLAAIKKGNIIIDDLSSAAILLQAIASAEAGETVGGVAVGAGGAVSAADLAAALGGTMGALSGGALQQLTQLVASLESLGDTLVTVATGSGTSPAGQSEDDAQTGSSNSDSPNAQFTVDTLSGG